MSKFKILSNLQEMYQFEHLSAKNIQIQNIREIMFIHQKPKAGNSYRNEFNFNRFPWFVRCYLKIIYNFTTLLILACKTNNFVIRYFVTQIYFKKWPIRIQFKIYEDIQSHLYSYRLNLHIDDSIVSHILKLNIVRHVN